MPNNQATADLAKKLQYEATFRGQVRRGFFREGKIFREQVLREDKLTDPAALRSIWTDIIKAQYTVVSLAFANLSTLPPLDAYILNSKLEDFVRQEAFRRSFFISRTSTKDMFIAKSEALKFLNVNKIDVTDNSLSRVGGRILRRMQFPRSENITVTETQSAAEGSKALRGKLEEKNQKEWITVSDSKVRPSHVSAHGQIRFNDIPFNVGGEYLRYPGDTSLGASVANVAYCRCAAIYG